MQHSIVLTQVHTTNTTLSNTNYESNEKIITNYSLFCTLSRRLCLMGSLICEKICMLCSSRQFSCVETFWRAPIRVLYDNSFPN